MRAIKRDDPRGERMAGHDLSRLRALFLAGERCDPDTLRWSGEILGGRPVIDHWWQTETGWAMAANCLGIEALPVKPGSPARAVPGYDIRVLDEDGHDAPIGEIGALCVRLPLPPGCTPTLWDDVINTAGHRLSTGQMEEVVAAHPDVAECAVVGVADDFKGQVPMGFAVLKAGVDRPHEDIAAELVRRVRDEIGPVASFRRASIVRALPKTRSGKVLRGTIRRMADGEVWHMPATIEDPSVLDDFRALLEGCGHTVRPPG
jgi:propionyl-CoA synthetase